MTTYNVDGLVSFTKALKSAQSGDTIALAAGNYTGLAITELKVSGITITSQDLAHQAILKNLLVYNANGVTFKNLEFSVDASKDDAPFKVALSKDVTFDHINLHGSLDGNAANDANAFLVAKSTGVTISNSEIQQLKNVVLDGPSDQVTLTGNNVHDIAGVAVKTVTDTATQPPTTTAPPTTSPPSTEPKPIVATDAGGVLNGTASNDIIKGGKGADEVHGKDGNDLVTGEAGNDSLNGEGGNDTLLGGDGNDVLSGGSGLNTLTGGGGADVFVFKAGDFANGVAKDADVIVDFAHAQGDKIDLSSVDANVATVGDEAFTLIGSNAFHKVAGELRYEVSGKNVLLLGDTNGDGVADVKILLTGASGSVTPGDLIL